MASETRYVRFYSQPKKLSYSTTSPDTSVSLVLIPNKDNFLDHARVQRLMLFASDPAVTANIEVSFKDSKGNQYPFIKTDFKHTYIFTGDIPWFRDETLTIDVTSNTAQDYTISIVYGG